MGKNTLRIDLLVVPQRRRRDLCTNQISNAPRHRRDVVPVTASARWRGGSRRSTQYFSDDLTHWLIFTQAATAAMLFTSK